MEKRLSGEIEMLNKHIEEFRVELNRYEDAFAASTKSEIDYYVYELNMEATESKITKVEGARSEFKNIKDLQEACKNTRPDKQLAELVKFVMTDPNTNTQEFVEKLYFIANCWDDDEWGVVEAGMSTRIKSWNALYAKDIGSNIALSIVEDLTRCYLGSYSGERPDVAKILLSYQQGAIG
jgi:hypothetical protein